MEHILELAEKNQQRAWEIIRKTNVIRIWESLGARVHLIGSLKLGLLMKHRDIDFHIYTPSLSVAGSFAAVARLAEHPSIKRIEYTNLLDAEDKCIEWHIWFEDRDGMMWQIDMIHIMEGSQYDGYFEDVAERIAAVLTEEARQTILQLKYETPDDEEIMGIEYYRAVIEGGVRTFDGLTEWRKANPAFGIVDWKP